VDVTSKAPFDQGGDVATVIYVGVGEDNGVDAPGIEGQVAVTFKRLRAMALEQATIQQNPATVDLNEVLRPRHSSRSTPEGDFQ
jgi:hypothetical protein